MISQSVINKINYDMKKMLILLPILAIIGVIAVFGFIEKTVLSENTKQLFLSPPSVLPDREKSLKAFSTILTVLKSPRCINCHPSGDVPHQGDMQILHPFGVNRGKANQGGLVQKSGP